MDIALRHDQVKAFRWIGEGLRRAGCTSQNGKAIGSTPDLVRWLIEAAME